MTAFNNDLAEDYINPPMQAMTKHVKGTPYRSKSYRAYMAYLYWRFGGPAEIAGLVLLNSIKPVECDLTCGYPVSPHQAYAAFMRETPKYNPKRRYVVPAVPKFYEEEQKLMVAALEAIMQKEDEAHAKL